MKHTLYQLAYRNVHKYKKHYLFVAIIIFVVSTIFMSAVLGYSNYYEVKKHDEQEHYGTWYSYMELTDYSEKVLDNILDYVENSQLHYGLWYNHGIQNEYLIGSMDEQLYDMCKIKIKEGKYPSQDNEIAISHQITEYKLHDTMSLQFDGKTKEYKIVGIVEKSQDLFPDVYTFNKTSHTSYLILDSVLGHSNDFKNIEYRFFLDPYDDSTQITYTPVFNSHGYSAGSLGIFQQASTQVFLLLEVLALVVIVLISMTSSSLKRRTKEFALLRGVGMTTRQLLVMVFYENLLTIFISLFVGTMLSFGIVYTMMLYLQNIYHYFIYQVDILTFLLYFVALLTITILATMFPVFNSVKYSLSGTFDSKRFQYIQVRYRKLKKQTLYRLALREMKVSKKMNLFMIGCFVCISIGYLYQFVDFQNKNVNYRIDDGTRYYVSYSLEEDNLKDAYQIPHVSLFHRKFIDFQTDYKEYKDFNSSISFLSMKDAQGMKDFVTGRFPEKENEILMRSDFEFHIDHYIDENTVEQESLEPIAIGDVVTLNGVDFTVVGKLYDDHSARFDLPYYDVIVMPEVFDQLKGEDGYSIYNVFEKRKDKETFIDQLVQYPFIQREDISTESMIIYGYDYGSLELNIDPILFVLPICAFLMFAYYLNKNDMMNHIQDYGLYSLIGMTHRELMIKQFFKALYISVGVLFSLVFWSLMYSLTLKGYYVPIIEITVIFICVLILSIMIYCVPLYSVLKLNVMDSLRVNE